MTDALQSAGTMLDFIRVRIEGEFTVFDIMREMNVWKDDDYTLYNKVRSLINKRVRVLEEHGHVVSTIQMRVSPDGKQAICKVSRLVE